MLLLLPLLYDYYRLANWHFYLLHFNDRFKLWLALMYIPLDGAMTLEPHELNKNITLFSSYDSYGVATYLWLFCYVVLWQIFVPSSFTLINLINELEYWMCLCHTNCVKNNFNTLLQLKSWFHNCSNGKFHKVFDFQNYYIAFN